MMEQLPPSVEGYDRYVGRRHRSGSRGIRAFATLMGYCIAVPLGGWALMLLDGVVADPDAGTDYLTALLWVTVGMLACEGVAAEWRYIRDGVR